MEDGAYFVYEVESFSMLVNLDAFRLCTENQLLILDDLNISKISVDKVNQFDLLPTEIRELFDKLEDSVLLVYNIWKSSRKRVTGQNQHQFIIVLLGLCIAKTDSS